MPDIATYDFTIRIGAQFSEALQVVDEDDQPVDLSAYTAKMGIKKDNKPVTPLLYELTTENGGITVDVDGNITLTIPPADTADITWQAARYDLVIIDASANPRVILEGSICATYVVSDVL